MRIEDRFKSVLPKRKVNYANVWERFAALIIDGLIVLWFSVIVSTKIYFPYCFITVAWLYEALQVSGFYHATLGQRVMNIKVSNKDGGSLDFGEASMRHFAKYVSLLTALSGYFISLLDRQHQCLHDKIADSFVVTEESFQSA